MALDPNVRTFVSGSVEVNFGDVIFTGFAEGSYITIERSAQAFEKKRGADGSVDRINKNVFDFTVTIKLKQTSITNDDLSTIFNSDLLNNDGIKSMTVKDLNGTSYFFATAAWIQTDPNDEYADDLGEREWKFDTGPAKKFTGGNVGYLT